MPRAARWASLLVFAALVILIVATIVRRSRQAQAPPLLRSNPVLTDTIVSITDGYRYTATEDGRRTFQLIAARDTSFADGRHELQKVDLTSYTPEGKDNLRVQAERGVYRPAEGIVVLDGQVRISNPDGLEVATESLVYNQREEVASTPVAMQFKRAAMSGSSTGAVLYAKQRLLALQQDARVVNTLQPDAKVGAPVEIKSARAEYSETEGIVRFTGDAVVVQGVQVGRADAITGFVEPETRKVLRLELRGSSSLEDSAEGRKSTINARDMDFFFDQMQHLSLAVATGSARAHALEGASEREITSEKLEARYTQGQEKSTLSEVVSQGRTKIRLGAEPADGAKKPVPERVIEADAVKVLFKAGGKYISEAEASGNAVLVVTPEIGPDAERKRMRASRMKAEFYESGNSIRVITAEGGAQVDFEPLDDKSKTAARTISGRKMSGTFHETTQDIADLSIEGEAKFVESDRQATASRAVYSSNSEMLMLRGRPSAWDASARTNAEEIDVQLGDETTLARGRVRTTYYSRETTGGTAPFKKEKAPVFLTADRAVVRHREGAARYMGDVRAWQDDNFVSAETIELDRNERMMTAVDGVQSALYSVERETEGGRREIVPLFVSADRLTYREDSRTLNYEGKVHIRQATDRIESGSAEALMDQENRLTRLTAVTGVVLVQPERRAEGDRLDYEVETETAILLGNPARIDDRARSVTTKGAQLTLHLRDARIEANDGSGARRVRTTHRIQR
ncbi:MAG: LPS export ABC transporter periplasmic protein LptC [Acidobacteria bacterium]|nr:LPS export ABC transporter periplasmic protein LptC [Acidobacteriota bacterium]